MSVRATLIRVGGVLLLTMATGAARATGVALSNPSFEAPPTAFALPEIDDWDEADLPGDEGGQVTGVFNNASGSPPITNVDGQQLAFIFALADMGIAISQVSVDAYQPGATYTASAWLGKSSDSVFGSQPPDDAGLQIRLFYQPVDDLVSRALDDAFLVASTTVFAGSLSTLSLSPWGLSSGQVLPGDAWANHPIGIAFAPVGASGGPNPATFNLDRVMIVPEPASVALFILGAAAMLRRRRCC